MYHAGLLLVTSATYILHKRCILFFLRVLKSIGPLTSTDAAYNNVTLYLQVTEDDKSGILIVSFLLLVLGIHAVPRHLRQSETKIYEGSPRCPYILSPTGFAMKFSAVKRESCQAGWGGGLVK